MKIAYFSPLPPLRTGIATYSRHLVPYLSKISEIELYHAGPSEIDLDIKINDFINNPNTLKDLKKFDAIVYHLGNSPYHIDIYRVFLEYSGTVVLHDAVLYHFFASMGVGSLIKEFCYNYGLERLSEIWDVIRENPEKYPLFKRVLDNAKQIIVHSRSTAELIRASGYSGCLGIVNLLYYPNQFSYFSVNNFSSLRKIGINENQVLIGIFGFLVPTKRVDKLLLALKKIKRTSNKIQFKLLIVGEGGDSFSNLIDRFGLSNHTVDLGFTTDEDFNRYLSMVDIVVNLRYPSMGESSASLIQAMSFGKPVIVTNHVCFSELPDDAVIKVGFGSTEVDEIAQAITKLITDKKYRENVGSNAKNYVQKFCDPRQVASEYLDILNKKPKLQMSSNSRVNHELPYWVTDYFRKKIYDSVPK